MITLAPASPYAPLLAIFGDGEIARCFSERAYVESWLEVERALAAVQADLGTIPAEAAEQIEREATAEKVNLARLREQTRVVGYPILPLLEQVIAASPTEVGKYLHWGATTQDIMDSGLVLQAKRALARIEVLLVSLGDALADKALMHRDTVVAGRTHGQQAVPTTLGSKVAVWLAETQRHLERLRAVRARVLVIQLFGAAGTAAALGPRSRDIRHGVARRLGLAATDVPWHTARDSFAELVFTLAAAAATCGKIGREVIELSRSEIGEVREVAGQLRGASSTMPQKANPIDSESVVGMSIVAAQQVPALLAAMQGTHERAAGEWHIEWDVLPTAFALAGGALAGAARIVGTLQVFPERMRRNLEYDGAMIMAEAVMMAAAQNLGRAQAHELVYAACAMAREKAVPFDEALAAVLGNDVLAALDLDNLLLPERYVGEAREAVDGATASWSRAREL